MRRNMHHFRVLQFVSLLFILAGFSGVGFGQTTLSRWDFPNNPDDATCDGGITANI
jgi:hypothetical protein